MWIDRTEKLVGADGINKLADSKVLIVGLGGVGGHTVIMLARAGVGNLTLVDFDKVDETNINRQMVANINTIGRYKTEVLKEQILEINPNCNVNIITEKLSNENIDKVFSCEFDYVVDAIDMVESKVSLCTYAYKNNIPIISAMGAGNRIDIPDFKVMDIYKTSNDGLAKVMRKRLRENEVKKLNVVCSVSTAIKQTDGVGSISYYPAMCGCVLAAKVICDLLG